MTRPKLPTMVGKSSQDIKLRLNMLMIGIPWAMNTMRREVNPRYTPEGGSWSWSRERPCRL
jgi:hypothetical protein